MGSRSHFKTFDPVETAHAIDANQVSVSFADGTAAIIDLSDIKGRGPWEKLADPAFFKRAHAAFGTIIWSDDLDLAPEDVWDRAQHAALKTTR